MAQLSNDCFATGGELMRLDDALALIASRVEPVAGRESVSLGEADNRVLAADVIAPIDLPPFDNSAVDGFAAVLRRHRRNRRDGAAGHRPDRGRRHGRRWRTGNDRPHFHGRADAGRFRHRFHAGGRLP
jgi:molybdopterin biosynthesis enzyme